MAEKLILARHGRSAHVHAGAMDLAGFYRWREAYEAAGVIAGEVAPPDLAQIAQRAGALVASNAPRAIESARLLAPGREPIVSPLLRELDLHPPNVRLRMPLLAWALAFGVRSLWRWMSRQPHLTTAEERLRIAGAAHWLGELTKQHGEVVVVTHHSFRTELMNVLRAEGWSVTLPRKRSAHWSAWTVERGE